MNKIFLFILAFLYNHSVFAEGLTLIPDSNPRLVQAFKTGEFSFNDISYYLVYLIDLASIIAVSVAFVYVIIWWARYILSFWEDKKAQDAKKTITNALLWLCLSALAWVIVDFIIRLFTA